MRKVTKGWNRFGVLLGVHVMTALMLITPANAGMMTYEVEFSANTFQVGSGGNPPPVDPVNGKVTLSFDPTVAVTNSTANITLDSLNISLGSAISFSYDPDNSDGFLTIGGINAGAGTIIFNPSTNDFWLFIDNFKTAPGFSQMGYTQTSVSSNNLFFTLNATGSASVTAVPEPSSFALLGLAGLAMTLVRGRFVRS